jgi:hypothetical protein
MSALQVISFPKSGRTWLRVMLDDIGAVARFCHDGSDYREQRPFHELPPDKSAHCAKTVLLLVRDPRDAVVSGYFQVTRRLNMDVGSLSNFIRNPRYGIHKNCHFNILWFSAAHAIKRFGILTYEQMHNSPSVAVRAVAKFLGTNIDGETAETVTSNRSFERMQAAEATGGFTTCYGNILRPGNPEDRESFKVRRGVIGGYRDYLSESDRSCCEAILAETGYWSRLNDAMSLWNVCDRERN